MNRVWKLGLIALMGALVIACGDDSDDGGGAGSGGGNQCGGEMGAPEEGSECASCVQTSCNSEVSACLGANWATGDFSGGSCEAQFECLAGCGCEDSACRQGCVLNNIASGCTSCLLTYGNCANSRCGSQCGTDGSAAGSGGGAAGTGSSTAGTGSSTAGTGSSTAGTGSSGGATCADLSACCSKLDSGQQGNCMTIAGLGQDSACASTYMIYSSGGLCP